jgi:hypothetical protein
MNDGEPTRYANDELARLRELGRSLGMPSQIEPESLGLSLPSAASMLERAKAAEAVTARGDAFSHRSKSRRYVIRGLAVAAAVTAVSTIVFSPWRQQAADATTPPVLNYEFASAQNIAFAPGKNARDELTTLAATASRQTPVSGPGSTQYLLTDNWFAELGESDQAELIPKRRQTWLRADGSLRARETNGSPLSPDGRGLSEQPPSNPSKVTDETYPADDLNPHVVTTLGSSVSDARSALMTMAQCEDRCRGPARAACLYQEITELYTRFVIPPTTAATFWRILASEPALRTLGSVTDRAGRPGVGIAIVPIDSPQFRKVLIISSATGQLLGTEDILIRMDSNVELKAPAIYSFSAILESRYTTATGPSHAAS